jgi:hypothetical protein
MEAFISKAKKEFVGKGKDLRLSSWRGLEDSWRASELLE